jgi:ATP-dependent Lon protease
MSDTTLDKLIAEQFSDVSVDKRLSRKVGGADRAIPDFVSDWLVARYTQNGNLDEGRIEAFLAHHLPDKSQKESVLYDLQKGATRKILDAYKVRVDVEHDMLSLEIPCLDKSNATIANSIVDEHPMLLYGNVWGSGTLVKQPDTKDPDKFRVHMIDFKPMQTSHIDLDYYFRARREFTLRQWREILVRSMGYNPEFYTQEQQMLLLTRLCPMVHPRVNLIELAPKGTGKSYIYSRLSRYGWLISGGIVTRAQLFYNMQSRSAGVITRYDAVILDEVQTIKLGNENEIIGALKGYLEQGLFRVMG